METTDRVNEYLRLTLKEMGKYGVPVTPQNYAVWYAYSAGTNQALREEVHRQLESDQGITAEFNRDIYRRYLGDGALETQDNVLIQIQRLVGELAEQMKNTDGKVASQGEVFQGYANELGTDSGLNGLKRIVSGLVTATKTMLETGETLRRKLADTSREVNSLRAELEQFKEMAVTDALTGLANRPAFEAALSRYAHECKVEGYELSMLFADIDHFKRVNDEYGHLVGDMVLRMAAAMIRGFIKGRDFAARYGGEEFVVILPYTGMKGAAALAENIRAFFETKKWRQKETGRSIGAITLSLGVSQYRPGESLSDFLQRADEALYRSKDGGRNRVTSEDEM